jgi:hypothetical protein
MVASRCDVCPRCVGGERHVDGTVPQVWNVRTGKAVVEFVKVHSEAVSSVMFSADGAQVLSGSHDTTARIHGLKSGKTLKEFRGHTSFVNDAKFSADGDTLATASSDGSVKVRRRFFVGEPSVLSLVYCVPFQLPALGRPYLGVLQDCDPSTAESCDGNSL